MHCVVGSGPSGVACAQALLEKGLTVRMLDAGLKLEPSRSRVVEQLAASPPSAWDPKLLAVLKDNPAAHAKGLPQKLAYGSAFPHPPNQQNLPCVFDRLGLKAP